MLYFAELGIKKDMLLRKHAFSINIVLQPVLITHHCVIIYLAVESFLGKVLSR